MELPGFQYTPLDASNGEIRLLMVDATASDAVRLEVTISTVPVRDAGEYIALSYTWGDHGDRRGISLNGHTFSVTRNLFEALRSFRQWAAAEDWGRGRSVKLWADAICL